MHGKHFFFDFETLGVDVVDGFQVLDLSFVTVDSEKFVSDNPYTFSGLMKLIERHKFDRGVQATKYGLKLDSGTVAWWKSRPKEVYDRVVAPSKNDRSFDESMHNLIAYLKHTKPDYWWSRGNNFDPVILQRIAKLTNNEAEIKRLLKYNMVRDTRSFIDAKLDFVVDQSKLIPIEDKELWNKHFQPHNSTHDIAADILRIQKIVRIEEDLPCN